MIDETEKTFRAIQRYRKIQSKMTFYKALKMAIRRLFNK